MDLIELNETRYYLSFINTTLLTENTTSIQCTADQDKCLKSVQARTDGYKWSNSKWINQLLQIYSKDKKTQISKNVFPSITTIMHKSARSPVQLLVCRQD